MVNDCPAGLEPPAGASNRRKGTVKIRRKMSPKFIRLDPHIVLKALLNFILRLKINIS